MQEYTFETPEPIELYAELRAGRIDLRAEDVTTTRVAVEGRDDHDVTVMQEGRQISIRAPRQGRLISVTDPAYDVVVTLPAGSDVVTKTGSAEVSTTGQLANGKFESGSGGLQAESFSGHVVTSAGSGRAHLARVDGEVRAKSGSGEIQVDACGGNCGVSTGSGDVRLGRVLGSTQVKTGSGDLAMREAGSDTTYKTGSGDLEVGLLRAGQLTVKGASGDVSVGVPTGTPVWADVRTVSGRLHNTMPSVGAPQDGQPYVELHVNAVSGDVRIHPAGGEG